MREEKTTCNNCGADITNTGKTPKFRLRLVAEALPHTASTIHAVLVYPPIKEDHHFCNLKCLQEWAMDKASSN